VHRESELDENRKFDLKPVGNRKKVMVIGGGPAGLEASRMAGVEGHGVMLLRGRGPPGGLCLTACCVSCSFR